MPQKRVGRLMWIAGVLLFLVSVAADYLGIGGAPGIGWKQIAGIVLGAAVATVGLIKLRAPGR